VGAQGDDVTVPTPDEYARLYWHARDLAAQQLRRELQALRAAAARPVTGYDTERVTAYARYLLDRIQPDPAHVIAQRRRDLAACRGGDPRREQKQTWEQKQKRAEGNAA